MKVGITGGSGFIGRALSCHLQEQGVPMRLLTRKRSDKKPEARYFVADLTKPDSLNGFFDGIDVIYHCAGELKNTAIMRALHVDGTAKLLEAAKSHIALTGRPLHWVQLSSVGAYGPPRHRATEERVVLETTPVAPLGDYEITKTLADDMVMQVAIAEPLFTYTILRPAIVIGKNMPNQSVRALVSVIRKKFFFYIGSTSAVANYIHVDDVVSALVLCGNDLRARGQTFNLSNDCLMSEIVNAVARKAGVAPPRWCVPEWPVRLLATFASWSKKSPLTAGRIDALVGRTYYPNHKINNMLGFAPRRSVPDAIAEFLE